MVPAQYCATSKISEKIFEVSLFVLKGELIEMVRANFKELLAFHIHPR
jgi:hypothetical protein